MRLTRILGGMTCEEMLERIDAVELVKWQAIYELEAEDEKHDHNGFMNNNFYR